MSNFNFVPIEQLYARYYQDPYNMSQRALQLYLTQLNTALKTETIGVIGKATLESWIEQAEDALNLMKGEV